jgi:cell division protein FtsB
MPGIFYAEKEMREQYAVADRLRSRVMELEKEAHVLWTRVRALTDEIEDLKKGHEILKAQ